MYLIAFQMLSFGLDSSCGALVSAVARSASVAEVSASAVVTSALGAGLPVSEARSGGDGEGADEHVLEKYQAEELAAMAAATAVAVGGGPRVRTRGAHDALSDTRVEMPRPQLDEMPRPQVEATPQLERSTDELKARPRAKANILLSQTYY